MHNCVFGGQYGSEGKGCVSEFIIRNNPDPRWTAIGENSPNSGHTCTAGSVRSIPAASFFADRVILGPDSVIDIDQLLSDITKVQIYRNTTKDHGLGSLPSGRLEVHIHPHAAWLKPHHRLEESQNTLLSAISSTGSGSGAARHDKYYHRSPSSVIHKALGDINPFAPFDVRVHSLMAWPWLVEQALVGPCVFECSQGFMLDTNFGRYPHVTSRSTSPRVAIERNGFGAGDWRYLAALRTFPIRTGGPSGNTGGKEVQPEDLGLQPEIATVTKRRRRMFEFDLDEFLYMVQLVRPDTLYFTHTDYLKSYASSLGINIEKENYGHAFARWHEEVVVSSVSESYWTARMGVYHSSTMANFTRL